MLVLAAPCAAGVIDRPERRRRRSSVRFVVLCLLSSATYLVNDVRDREQDRLHPRKRSRPVAAGELSPRAALRFAAALAVAGPGARDRDRPRARRGRLRLPGPDRELLAVVATRRRRSTSSRSPPGSCCARSPAASRPTSTCRAGLSSSLHAVRSSWSQASATPSFASTPGPGSRGDPAALLDSAPAPDDGRRPATAAVVAYAAWAFTRPDARRSGMGSRSLPFVLWLGRYATLLAARRRPGAGGADPARPDAAGARAWRGPCSSSAASMSVAELTERASTAAASSARSAAGGGPPAAAVVSVSRAASRTFSDVLHPTPAGPGVIARGRRAQLRRRRAERRRHGARHDRPGPDHLDRRRARDSVSAQAGVTIALLLAGLARARAHAAGGPRHAARDDRGRDRERHPRQEPPPRRWLRPARRVALAVHSRRRAWWTVSPETDAELFYATLGGMGLTGRRRRGDAARRAAALAVGGRPTSTAPTACEQTLELMGGDERHRYSVAWLDLLADGPKMGRGDRQPRRPARQRCSRSGAPGDAERRAAYPAALSRRPAIRGPRALSRPPCCARRACAPSTRCAGARPRRERGRPLALAPHFFPLDGLGDWNRLYGARGLIQYQFVVPSGAGGRARALRRAASATRRLPVYLAVLKRLGPAFGGPLSFPLEGWTLALDIPAGRARAALGARRARRARRRRRRARLPDQGRPPAAAMRWPRCTPSSAASTRSARASTPTACCAPTWRCVSGCADRRDERRRARPAGASSCSAAPRRSRWRSCASCRPGRRARSRSSGATAGALAVPAEALGAAGCHACHHRRARRAGPRRTRRCSARRSASSAAPTS